MTLFYMSRQDVQGVEIKDEIKLASSPPTKRKGLTFDQTGNLTSGKLFYSIDIVANLLGFQLFIEEVIFPFDKAQTAIFHFICRMIISRGFLLGTFMRSPKRLKILSELLFSSV